jgi:UPF0755 protein
MKKQGRGAIIAVFLVAIVIFGVIYEAWSMVTTVFEPPATNQSKQVTLTIQPKDTPAQVADELYRDGLIRNPTAFVVWAKVKGLDKTLEAGVYTLTPGMTIDGIITKLQNGQPDGKNLLVVEGYRLEQIAEKAGQAGLVNFSKQDFLNYTHNPGKFPDAAKYPILQGKKSMEGLLYPDTYVIPVNYNTTQIIDMMLTEFTNALQTNNLATLAQKHQLNEYTMITLASIVQREASNAGQMPLIAGIYWNRIYKSADSDIGGPYLKSDPTVEYAYYTDHPPTDGNYWNDLNNLGKGANVDPTNHWNTYNFPGWTPTPISSPGLVALKAAASPQPTNCYYFLTKPSDGSLVCTQTYPEFLQAVAKYLK